MQTQTIEIRLGRSGFCCELNHLIAACAYCDDHGLRPYPTWCDGLYSQAGEDAFPAFFERDPAPANMRAVLVRDAAFRAYRIASPRGPRLPAEYIAEYGCEDFLAPPTDRARARRVIDRHLRPVPAVRDSVQWFGRLHNLTQRHVVGLHLRGPGRLHGGAILLSDRLGRGHPPYDAYFDLVDRHLTPDSLLLLATDAGCVVGEVARRYPQNLIVSSQCLPAEGEPHKLRQHSPYVLGADVLKDCWALASYSNVFVHGNSNVANFIQCLAPQLPSHDVYAEVYPQ